MALDGMHVCGRNNHKVLSQTINHQDIIHFSAVVVFPLSTNRRIIKFVGIVVALMQAH